MSSDDRGPLVLTPDMIQERVRLVEVADLAQWDGPSQGDVGAAHTFMGTFGQFQLPVVVDGEVIYGQEFVAAEVMGEQFGGRVAVLDVTDLDWPREKVVAAVLGLDRLHALAQVDAAQLLDQLQEVRKADEQWLAGAGYDADDLEAIYEQLQRDQEALDAGAGQASEDDALDDVPEFAPARTKPGDVWRLGPHRIMCGDCRDPEHVATLLDGVTINLAFTSPPYADRRKYDEASGFKAPAPDEYVEWFEPVQATVAEHLAEDGSWFVNIKPASNGLDSETYVLDLVLAHARRWGWHWATEYCWERGGLPQVPHRRFKNAFEPVYQFARDEWKFRPEAVQRWSENVPKVYAEGKRRNVVFEREQGGDGANFDDIGTTEGLAYPSNRLPTFAGSHEATGHTAAFPVGLPAWFCKAYTDRGDTVFDPFMGSGSTLIAAHTEGRVGYGMEISPKYCDVICARWQRLTGEKPILAATGEAHDFAIADQ